MNGHLGWRMAFGGATLTWMGLIFYLTSLPQADPPKVPPLDDWQSPVGHLGLYGVCACLMEASIWDWVSGYRLRWTLASAITATAYGISDEFHQSFVAGRHATIEDAIANTARKIDPLCLVTSGPTRRRTQFHCCLF